MSARRMLAVLVYVAFGMACAVTNATAQETPVPFALADVSNTGFQTPIAPVPPTPPAQAAPAQPPSPVPAPVFVRPPLPARTGPRLTSLSAVLVTGDEGPAVGRGSGPQLEVPEAARKALASISSFLPYKSYSMVDAALISASSRSGAVVVLRDPALPNTPLRLFLQPGGSPSPGVDTYEIGVTLTETESSKPDDKSSRQVLSARVNVELGETVVVGTSRLQGDKALIVLLTAVAK